MTEDVQTPQTLNADTLTPARKPRIAIMGEFSAGKSTLSNLLLGARPLPEKVTATRLSPVWMSHGTDTPYKVNLDGVETPISLAHLQEIAVEDTRVIRLFFEADILEICDIIDFPGISDPNMDSIVWERVLDEVDMVLWCTHATQAWRQSEQAVWETIPAAVQANSMLLVTRFDKLTNDRDKGRVVARLTKETRGQFVGVFPISLTQALAAGEDTDAWIASGGAAFSEKLVDIVECLATGRTPRMSDPKPVATAPAASRTVNVDEMAPKVSPMRPFQAKPAVPDAPKIIPRRVRPVAQIKPEDRMMSLDDAADSFGKLATGH